ncbi:MAG: hybrid sensor histidine kinase/response regulator, partial [Acidobacteriota bacterium]
QKPSAESRNLTYEFTSDSNNINVFADAGRLQQVFTNLITNAIKYTPDGGDVTVDIKTTSDAAVATVRDSGKGISQNSLPNIFRQFSQADPATEESRSGLGLGLSIVNILVGKHGGSVVAESKGPGHGSKFTVTIPLSASKDLIAAPPLENHDGRERPLDGLRIILVEDDPDSREVLHLFLEQNGARVKSTDSATVAIDMLVRSPEGRTDVLISDLAMPAEDGFSMISRIRELPPENGGNVPALALSAFASPESRQRAVEAGFHGYNTKPFEPEHLISTILGLVQKLRV